MLSKPIGKASLLDSGAYDRNFNGVRDMRKIWMMLVLAGVAGPLCRGVALADPGTAPESSVVPEASPAPDPAPEEAVVKEASISAEPDVADDIDRYLASKGWVMGENSRPDGSVFFVSIGQGVIAAPRDSRAYLSSRINAFEKALLDAKRGMVEYLETKVVKEVLGNYQEGGAVVPGDEKSAELMKQAVDQELSLKGISPESPEAAQTVRELLASSRFRSLTRTLAQSRILGLQVFKTFEATPAGKDGQMGVICIQSEKLQQMAESMWTGAPLPPQAAKVPLLSQIPSDKAILMSSYGVQQKTDDQGNLVLVAFAQAQPASASVHAENAAYDKAKTGALGLLRQFAGEAAHVATVSRLAESVSEYESGAIDYGNESAYNQQVRTYAEEMGIQGVAVIRKWRAVHPITGGKVVGVVCSWSPGSARRAAALKQRIPAGAVPGGPGDAASAAEPARTDASYHGEGAEGDQDSF